MHFLIYNIKRQINIRYYGFEVHKILILYTNIICYILYEQRTSYTDVFSDKQINKFLWSGKSDNKIYKIRILFFSFSSFHLRLIIVTSSAAEANICWTGRSSRRPVSNWISDILVSRNANRSPLWSITMLCTSNRRPVRPLRKRTRLTSS